MHKSKEEWVNLALDRLLFNKKVKEFIFDKGRKNGLKEKLNSAYSNDCPISLEAVNNLHLRDTVFTFETNDSGYHLSLFDRGSFNVYKERQAKLTNPMTRQPIDVVDAILTRREVSDIIVRAKCQNKRPDFTDANLCDADLASLHMPLAIFKGANLKRTDLSYTTLNKSNFEDADLSQSNLEHTNFSQSNMSRALICGVEASKACFSGATLIDSKLNKGNFAKANFKKANCNRSILRNASFDGAKMNNAFLGASVVNSKTSFENTNFGGAVLFGIEGLDETNIAEAIFGSAADIEFTKRDLLFQKGVGFAGRGSENHFMSSP